MQTTQIATVVMCGLLIGYLIAEVSHSIQDWLLLTSLTVVLVCSLFVMFNDIRSGCACPSGPCGRGGERRLSVRLASHFMRTLLSRVTTQPPNGGV